MRSIGLFLAALGKRWWASRSSAAVTVSIVVGAILFLIASFGAWKEQDDLRMAAERLNDDSKRRKETGLKLADLMRREPDIRQRLISAPNDADPILLSGDRASTVRAFHAESRFVLLAPSCVPAQT